MIPILILYPLFMFILAVIIISFGRPALETKKYDEYIKQHECTEWTIHGVSNRAQARAFHYYNGHQKENCWCGR